MNFKINYKKVFFIFSFVFLIGSAVFVRRAFSYDTNVAHPLLTKKAIEEFNKTTENKISEKEIDWIVQGSKDEDANPRWMNHFYDPVNNKGLFGFLTAKEWSKANIQQSLYLAGNQTWQKAIESYQKNKKQEAFIALGHILHLIEDMAVPAHTRADPHDPDPYEEWVKNNSEQEFDTIDVLKADNLDQYFYILANYSNKSFFSKDTIYKYPYPELDGTVIEVYNLRNFEYGYKLINNKKIKIVKIIRPLAFLPKSKIEYVIDDPVIHQSYYSLLAPRAVATSAGVIELFFKEAGKEVKKELEPEQLSWWGSIKNKIADFFDTVKSVFFEKENVDDKNDSPPSSSFVQEESIIKSASAEETKEPTAVWDAELVEQNKIGSIKAGETAEVFARYKNSGNQDWTPQNVSLNIYGLNAADFYDSSWITEKRPALISAQKVEPSQAAEFRFKIKAPKEAGSYKIAFIPVYQIDHNFKWLGNDVARWQFDVVGDEEDVAAKSDLTRDVNDVVVKGVEYDENQENKKSKNQESNETTEHENTIRQPAEQKQENNKTKKFVRALGDGTPPGEVVLTFPSNPFYLTNQNHITLEGQKASDVAQINIKLNDSGEVILKDFIDEYSWQYEVDLVEGENTITFVAQDSSKNSSKPVVLNIILDTSPPSAPVVTTNNGEDFTTAWAVAFLNGTKASDGYFVFAGNNEAEIIDGNNWQAKLNLEEGENLISIFAKDLAGNSSDVASLKITRDSSLLAINLTDAPPALTNQTSANFAFSAGVDVGQFYCQLDSEDEAACLSPFLVKGLLESWHQFNVHTSNSQITPANYQWFVDLTPPSDPELILNSGGGWTNQREINSDISLSGGAAFWMMTEDSAVPEINDSDWKNAAKQTFSSTFTLSDLDETKTVYLWAMDEAGNVNVNAVSKNITLDTSAPACEVAELASEQNTKNFNLTINYSDNFGVKNWDVEYQVDGGEWQFLVNDSTDNAIEFIGEDGKSYGFRCEAADMANNVSAAKGAADAITTVDLASAVIINEVAWMGTKADLPNDEWIELYNNTNQDIDLSGWKLEAIDGTPNIELSKIISANGYFLLERTNDTTVSSIVADLIYAGVLGNSGEYLKLKNPNGKTIDEIDASGSWFAGDNGTKATMERVSSLASGMESSNWKTNNKVIVNGSDANGNPIFGTPKQKNSASFSLGPMTIIDRDITTNTIWQAKNNPYVVTREITVDCAKLTIEAGVIVKFMPGAGLILGENETAFMENIYKPKEIKTLVAQNFFSATKESKRLFSMAMIRIFPAFEVFGQEGNEVIFTSIYDDSYGGDSILNGSDILPQAGDWGGIVLNNYLSAEFENTIIRYGGHIDIYDAELAMTNVEMKNNQGGVKVLHGNARVNISDSDLDNADYNIDNSFNGDPITDPVQNYLYGYSL